MIILHLFGLSGVGKTTLSVVLKEELLKRQYKVEILDGDEFRTTISRGLSYSKEDRIENIRRMFEVAKLLAKNEIITIIAAISPYNEPRRNYKNELSNSYFIWLKCDLEILKQRDTKGLYKRALLNDFEPDKITNMTGVNDVFEEPSFTDLTIDTGEKSIAEAKREIINLLEEKLIYYVIV